jgi:Tfp pilus assembly protein PilF
MSLITDLLSKVKKQEPRRDIPPILKDNVLQLQAERRMRRKLMSVLILTLVLVAAGVGVIYMVESMKGPSLIARTPATGTPPVQSVPQTAAPAPSPQAYAGTPLFTSGDIKVREQAVAPEQKKDLSKPSRGKKGGREFAHKSTPKVLDRVQEMKQEKAVSREHAELDKTSGSMTRQEKDTSLYLARTYEAQKNYRQALIQYKKVLAMEPNNFVVMNNVASMLIYLGSYEEAIQYAQKALNLRRGHVFSLINLGISYSCLGKHSESESYFRKVLGIEPSNQYALLNLGLLYEKQSAFESAERYYRKLSEGENIQGCLGMARIAEKQNKVDEAIRFYRMAISMENIDPQTSNMVNERLIRLTK